MSTIKCPKCRGEGTLYMHGTWRTSQCSMCMGAGTIASEGGEPCCCCGSQFQQGCEECKPQLQGDTNG